MNHEIRFCGISLKSPVIIGSGPASYAAEGMVELSEAGAGAVVTKTIRNSPAKNPYPHIAKSGRDSLINAEKWSDLPGSQWVEKEIPQARDAGVTVIASIGHTEEEAEVWSGAAAEAGAAMIELVSYKEETLLPMIRKAKELTDIPVIAKLSPNWPDIAVSAEQAAAAGADALTVMDSLGPVMRIDIDTGRPLLGGAGGMGWLTGSCLLPLTIASIVRIRKHLQIPIIGLGGVMVPEDGIEVLMAGADAVGMCTYPLLKGSGRISSFLSRMDSRVEKIGCSSYSSLSGIALDQIWEKERAEPLTFAFNQEICVDCGLCAQVCSYKARRIKDRVMELDEEQCRYCGLCVSVCPTSALTFY